MGRREQELREGERLLWSGQPGETSLLEPGNSRRILTWEMLVPVLAAALLCLSMLLSGVVRWIAFGGIALGAAVLLFLPVWERRRVLGQRYQITTQRVLLEEAGGKVRSLELSQVDVWRRVTGFSDGGDCLVLGSRLFRDAAKRLRWRAGHPSAGRQGVLRGLVLYGLSEADTAAQALRECGCPQWQETEQAAKETE